MSIKERDVTVLPNDAWVLLLSTIRYSMGRQTYMTELAPELVVRYAAALTDDQLRQIATEISEALERATNMSRTLGSEGDHERWFQFTQDIHVLIDKRNHPEQTHGTP